MNKQDLDLFISEEANRLARHSIDCHIAKFQFGCDSQINNSNSDSNIFKCKCGRDKDLEDISKALENAFLLGTKNPNYQEF